VEAFWAEARLPSGVRGPVECWALARLALARWAEQVGDEDMTSLLLGGTVLVAIWPVPPGGADREEAETSSIRS
jgi:hypothetical protein